MVSHHVKSPSPQAPHWFGRSARPPRRAAGRHRPRRSARAAADAGRGEAARRRAAGSARGPSAGAPRDVAGTRTAGEPNMA